MTIQNDITTLIESLTQLASISLGTSESANRAAKEKAQTLVRESDLDQDTIKSICSVIAKASNPSGWYYDTNGINAGLVVLEELEQPEPAEANAEIAPVKTSICLNRTNLKNLVSNGAIFNVKFVKRTTGELRSMTCRLGVQKHLKDGKKGFSDTAKDLLTVFDMSAKGYRSIPMDGIQSLSVNGQSFSFAEAV